MFYVVIIFLAVIALFFLYLFLSIIFNALSNLVFGKKVNCFVKEVNRDDKRQKDGTIYRTHLKLMCEFEYNGQKYEKELIILNVKNVNSVKVGDKLSCKYNTLTKKLVPFSTQIVTIKFKMVVTAAIFLAIYMITIYDRGIIKNSFIEQGILYILCAMVWYSSILLFYHPNKADSTYVKIKGKVVDYHLYRYSDSEFPWDYYIPELKFNYNGEEKNIVSEEAYIKKPFSIGQEIDIFYSPEEENVFIYNDNKLLIVMMLIPVVIVVIELLKLL